MPPMYLRRSRRYCLGYCSDMRIEVEGNIGHPSVYRRHAGGKALRWPHLPAAHVVIRLRSSPGGTGGYVADTLGEKEGIWPVSNI